jgi:hypothetical protein
MLERQDLCDKYFEGEVARCLNENKRIHIYTRNFKLNKMILLLLLQHIY